MAEILRTDVTYWQSALLFYRLFDFFALWLASDVQSTEFQVKYNLMTFGDMLHDGSGFGKLISSMEHAKRCNDLTIKANFFIKRILVLHQALEAHISANICNICKCYIRQMYRK